MIGDGPNWRVACLRLGVAYNYKAIYWSNCMLFLQLDFKGRTKCHLCLDREE